MTPTQSRVRVGLNSNSHNNVTDKENPPLYSIDTDGRRRLAAFIMALSEVNNKTDGIMDSILPNTAVKFSFHDSKRDSGHAVINSVDILSKKRLPQNVSLSYGCSCTQRI